ncbi:phage protease (plasmid) [Mycobacterium sp. SMC-2]|uniref:phage protease n=1 Tax=Mycobacterium sp. SMC-2 TaxID=2857058 RepID=UPI0021B2C00B|nr:phage protease [Mycobacterium sp. SMC-2]UXA06579.1 phage protease [Mycobacterium sp. SMC-2]UXA09670.1 phage protease [Mycobacterium sp. SMC-2]
MVNLVTVPGIELMRTGKWDLSTGEWECTAKEIAAAIDAHDKGLLRKPVIRLGHNDPRFSGDPAVGWLDNLRASEDGQALIGDMVGVPEWLAEILPSAYPSRSIEGLYDYTAPDGSEHDFVLTGLALLGATRPGVESLQSLQDVARLYDIAAAAQVGGKAIELTVEAATYRDRTTAKEPWGDVDYADPGFLDENDQPAEPGHGVKRYPLNDRDHVKSAWDFINEKANAKLYTPTQLAHIRSAIESAAKKFGITIEAASASETEGGAVVALPEKVAEALGIDASADEDAVLAKIAELTPAAAPETAPAAASVAAAAAGVVNGLVQIEQAQLDELKAAAAQGVEARARQIAEDDERTVMAAISQGKIAPARKDHWLAALKADRDGTKQVLASLAAGLIPVAEVGHQGVAGHVSAEGAPDSEQQAKEYANARIMAALGIPTTKESN